MQVSVGMAAGAREWEGRSKHESLLVCLQPWLLVHMSSNMFTHAFG